MEIRVLFFGVLTDIAGTGMKIYSGVKSFSDLKFRINDDFPEMVHYDFRISVNSTLIENEPTLNNGDEVALMPPFAGG